MKQFFYDFKSARSDLKLILYLCLCGILIHDLWLDDMPELVSFGSELGRILYGIGASYIASFIFYFLVVHVENERERRMFNPYVQMHIRYILHSVDSLLREIVRVNRPGVDVNPDVLETSEAKELFGKIDPKAMAPFVIVSPATRGNWMQFLNFCRRQDLENIRRILEKGALIETELNRLLSDIEVSRYFATIAHFEYGGFSNNTLEAWSDSFEDYLKCINALKCYAKSRVFLSAKESDFSKV